MIPYVLCMIAIMFNVGAYIDTQMAIKKSSVGDVELNPITRRIFTCKPVYRIIYNISVYVSLVFFTWIFTNIGMFFGLLFSSIQAIVMGIDFGRDIYIDIKQRV